MKHRVMSFLAVLVLTVPVLAMAASPKSNITGISFVCSDSRANVTVTITGSDAQTFRAGDCNTRSVAAAVAERFDLFDMGRTPAGLTDMVREEVTLTGSPLAWLGQNWGKLALGIFVLVTFFSNVFVVRQQTVYIIERLGKYARTADAGLKLKLPFIERAVQDFNLRQQQEPVTVDSKTKDNVFLEIGLAIQYKVTDPKRAFYELADFAEQLKAYVFDEVRAAVPSMDFDEVFQNKEELAEKVRNTLSGKMDKYGYQIIDVLVTDITPPDEVQKAMNQVVEQQKLRQAATEKGEGEKVLVIKQAEAQAARDKLHGEGIANFRKAIAHGIKESMEEVRKGAPELTDDQVSALLVTTQYFDTVKEVAGRANSNTVFLPGGPNGGHEVFTQMTAALAANHRPKNGHDKTAPPVGPVAETAPSAASA